MALAFDLSSIDQNACIGGESSKSHHNVTVQKANFPNGTLFLQFCYGFLFHAKYNYVASANTNLIYRGKNETLSFCVQHKMHNCIVPASEKTLCIHDKHFYVRQIRGYVSSMPSTITGNICSALLTAVDPLRTAS